MLVKIAVAFMVGVFSALFSLSLNWYRRFRRSWWWNWGATVVWQASRATAIPLTTRRLSYRRSMES